MKNVLLYIAMLAVAAVTSCSGRPATVTQDKSEPTTVAPAFDADSAYGYVERQVAFGPRVPGSASHRACADYLASELRRHGADTVIEQHGEVTVFDGTRLPVRNIMARFGTEAPRRVLVAAHYDTRRWADNEADADLRNRPIDGANDGGSGTGVILELARMIGTQRPEAGVDLLLVDVEDYGYSDAVCDKYVEDSDATWCLGTQYWAARTGYTAATRPVYAIVLDMVGGRDAKFYRELQSDLGARSVVDKVWGIASTTDWSDRFVNGRGGALVDDHVFIQRAGIPAIDIVEFREDTGFPATWHTHADNMEHIDRNTLKAAGQVVAEVIYRESGKN